MALDRDFPLDPYILLYPEIRRHPGDELAIKALTVHDSGSTRVNEHIKLSTTHPQVVRRRETFGAFGEA